MNAAQLARVIAAPDDDDVRLAIANELGEGNPRAEFIRLQVARARGDHAASRKRRSEETLREETLLGQYAQRWAEEVGPFVRVPADMRGLSFHRGFVARADVKRLADADQAFARAPIEVLSASGSGFDVAALLKAPWLGRVRALILSGIGGGDALARSIAGCERLGRLRYLALRHNDIGRAGVEALAAAPRFAALRRLDLGGNDVNPVEVPAYDEAGYIVATETDPLAAELEAAHGHRAWLHCGWDSRADEPDEWM